MARAVALFLIRAYQRTLSPDHGPFRRLFPYGYCQFHPSCSQYGYECIARHGVVKGGAFTVLRILRCNPFSKGGLDPIPE